MEVSQRKKFACTKYIAMESQKYIRITIWFAQKFYSIPKCITSENYNNIKRIINVIN